MPALETARLTYNLMTAADLDLMLDLNSDPAVMRYINGGKPTSRAEMITRHIPRMESFTNPEKGRGLWRATTKDTDEFIGWFMLKSLAERPDEIEIGWRLKKKFWGKGYATEGAAMLYDFAGKQPGIKKIFATALPENSASHKIMTKIGMKYIKTARHHDPAFPEIVVYYQ